MIDLLDLVDQSLENQADYNKQVEFVEACLMSCCMMLQPIK